MIVRINTRDYFLSSVVFPQPRCFHEVVAFMPLLCSWIGCFHTVAVLSNWLLLTWLLSHCCFRLSLGCFHTVAFGVVAVAFHVLLVRQNFWREKVVAVTLKSACHGWHQTPRNPRRRISLCHGHSQTKASNPPTSVLPWDLPIWGVTALSHRSHPMDQLVLMNI